MTAPEQPTAPIDGAALLDEVEAFHRRFNVFPTEAAYVAVALWDAHAHLLDCFDSTPRLAFLSPEPGSGKSRALEIVETLVPHPMVAVNASAAALFRAVSGSDGRPTILFDEIDTVFGPKAGDNEELRGFLNAATAAPASPTGASATAATRPFKPSRPTPPSQWPDSAHCPTQS